MAAASAAGVWTGPACQHDAETQQAAGRPRSGAVVCWLPCRLTAACNTINTLQGRPVVNKRLPQLSQAASHMPAAVQGPHRPINCSCWVKPCILIGKMQAVPVSLLHTPVAAHHKVLYTAVVYCSLQCTVPSTGPCQNLHHLLSAAVGACNGHRARHEVDQTTSLDRVPAVQVTLANDPADC
jgi:hypothetical protein